MKLGGGMTKEDVSSQVPWSWVKNGLAVSLLLLQTHSLGDAVFTLLLSEGTGNSCEYKL